MNLWLWILAACALSYATKLLGFLVPPRWLEEPRMLRTAGALTVGLLAGLTAVNAFTAGQELVVDARLAALAAAGLALWLRAPFLVVVLAGAAAAALMRLAGWG